MKMDAWAISSESEENNEDDAKDENDSKKSLEEADNKNGEKSDVDKTWKNDENLSDELVDNLDEKPNAELPQNEQASIESQTLDQIAHKVVTADSAKANFEIPSQFMPDIASAAAEKMKASISAESLKEMGSDLFSTFKHNFSYHENLKDMLKKSANTIAEAPNIWNQGMKMFDSFMQIDQINAKEGLNSSQSINSLKSPPKDAVSQSLTFEKTFNNDGGSDLVCYLKQINQIGALSLTKFGNDADLESCKKIFDDLVDFETDYSHINQDSVEHFKSIFNNLCQRLLIDVSIETWFDDWFNFEHRFSFAKKGSLSDKNLMASTPYRCYLDDLSLFVRTNAQFVRCLCDNLMQSRSTKQKSLVKEILQLYNSSSPVLKYIGQQSFWIFDAQTEGNEHKEDFHTRILSDVFLAKRKLSEIYNYSAPFLV